MKERGITLIALIVTIIILIILAGITIATLTGDDGIINNANNAKEETEIANEKEIVDRATINAMGNNKRGSIVEDELQDELDRITKVGNTEVEDNGEEFEVVFVNTQRYYTVNKDGDIIEEGKIVEDKSPGDITKDENGNSLRGDESEPYEIWCIEDLIEWSNNFEKYQNSNIILCNNLNFKSRFSYTDSTRTDYGDINHDEKIESLMIEMQSGDGFIPISKFSGTFDGNNNILKNIYINNKKTYTGLFSQINSNTIIKNLSISGIINSNKPYIGAITGSIANMGSGGKIENCHNYSQISGTNYVGGIVGYILNSSKFEKIINCSNEGNIVSTTKDAYIGGIIGNTDAITLTIENCFNKGNVQGSGITGNNRSYIKNCYNAGTVKYGLVQINQAKIVNCYNIGNSDSRYLVNNNSYTNSYMYNCTYLNGTANDIAKNNTENSINISSCTSMESINMKEETFLNNLNKNPEGVVDVWIKDTKNINNGYPILIWQNMSI